MSDTRKISAILAADVVGYSRLTEADEDRTLARLRALWSDLIDPTIAVCRGRIVKRTGDGVLVDFRSVVDAVRCAIEVQNGMVERNTGLPTDRQIELRIGIHLGDVVEESNGDLMGDGVNIAARLEGVAKPGAICLSEDAYRQVKARVNVAVRDLGPTHLKNIAEPIRIYSLEVAASAQAKSATENEPAELRTSAPPLALPDKPSIAVMPFQNMSGDPEQEYFCDGIVEDIITALSHFRHLFVIARNSSFTYKRRPVSIAQVSRELGVRYVLEGSVRKSGTRLRITCQLIEARTDSHLWAHRFDGELEDIFELQDRITERVVGSLLPKLEQAEIDRVKHKPTESLDAYDYYLRGMESFHRMTKESIDEALQAFHRAIELDEEFAAAYGMTAYCYVWRKTNGWITDRSREIAETTRLAQHAIELGRNDPIALGTGGFALAHVVGDLDRGISMIDMAREFNPNLANLWLFSGWARTYLSDSEAAIEHLTHAMRLSPFDPQAFATHLVIGFAHFLAGRYDEASSWAEKALREQPNFAGAARVAAASHAYAGRIEQARQAMVRLRQIDPTLCVSNLKEVTPLRSHKDLARYGEGLRMAGLPE